MVDEVVRLGAEGQGLPLLNRKTLHQRRVYVEESRAPECVATRTAGGAGGRESEIGDLGRREIVDPWTSTVVAGHHAADVARTREVAVGAGRARTSGAAGTDGKWRAALQYPETAQVPSANQSVQQGGHRAAQHLAFAYGELVQSRRTDDMGYVEIGAPARQGLVETVERRGEPVALASGARRLVVIDRLAPGVVGPHRQR